ncbi:Uncharacterised protein [Fusobacterium necrophorum subsp. necrophorum]|nr:Uncharacterised protein [Fusobacterium necrophorum subsp. necrophorum]
MENFNYYIPTKILFGKGKLNLWEKKLPSMEKIF